MLKNPLKRSIVLLRPLYIHRHQSTSAKDVISTFLSNKSNRALSPIETLDFLSPTQSHLLSTTLTPYLPFPLPRSQSTLLQGHHLVYFPTAAVPESQLDSDGTETTYNPGHPFSRRMWAGGRIEWTSSKDLKVATQTREVMELDTLESKTRSSGGEMIVMSIRKKLFQDDEEFVRETRQWVFLKEGDVSASQTLKRPSTLKQPTKQDSDSMGEKSFEHQIMLTPAALFRYSALLFNSHKIHLDKEHCLKEGHPDLVVHGPLTLSLLLEGVRGSVGRRWKSVVYRAVGPAYVSDVVRLCVGLEKEGKVEACAEKGDRIPIMKVTVEFL